MMICSGSDHLDTVAAAQRSLNTVKAVGEELEECEWDLVFLACRRQHSKQLDVAMSPDSVRELQKKVRKEPGKVLRSLARDVNSGNEACTE